MNHLKRTWISMMRKPLQSILMFLIIFVLGNVLFASIAIKQASENVRLEMRARVPSYISIMQTNDNQSSAVQSNMKKFVSGLEGNENILDFHTIEIATFAIPEKTSDHDPYHLSEDYYISHYDFLKLDELDNSIYDYEILDGRFYTQDELIRGDYKIVLEQWQCEVYDYNEDGIYGLVKTYEVGDKITYSLYNYKIQLNNITDTMSYTSVDPDFENLINIDFEIVGIVKKTLKDEYADKKIYIDGIEIPSQCIDEMIEKQTDAINAHPKEERDKYKRQYDFYVTNTSVIKGIEIVTNGIDGSEKLQEEILSDENYQKSYYSLTSGNEDYRYIQAPLENLVALANVAEGASVLLVIILLSLVSFIFIRKRTKEVGILMSLGEKKRNILIQFVSEMLIVGLLATTVSMFSGSYLGEMASKEFMKIQIDTDYELEYSEKNPETITQLDLLDAYEIEIDVKYISTIYSVSTLILIVSSMTPIIYMLKIQPKKILI